MALPPEHLLDELATAYVQAVAAAAGAIIAVSRLDYGVDGTLKQIIKSDNRFIESGYPVDFQLKGTTIASIDAERGIRYDLSARNYNLLVERDPSATPYYLFLVCFGAGSDNWVVEEPERLTLTASSFWWKQSGGASENTSSVRISIPLEQRLNTTALADILQSARNRFVV